MTDIYTYKEHIALTLLGLLKQGGARTVRDDDDALQSTSIEGHWPDVSFRALIGDRPEARWYHARAPLDPEIFPVARYNPAGAIVRDSSWLLLIDRLKPQIDAVHERRALRVSRWTVPAHLPPTAVVTLRWTVDGYSGSTTCAPVRARLEIDALERAGYTITDLETHP